ncbi:MAG: DUF5106 domain-containing protein [Odoribacter sp.]
MDIIALSEKYPYDPHSPFRNEELYIAVLLHIVANGKSFSKDNE